MSETGTNRLLDMEDEDEFIDPEVALQSILEDPSLCQHVTRTETDGRETSAGYYRIEFKPNQQRQIIHVPFTPPLKSIPQVQARSTDRHDVRIRVTDRQKFGIRAEVILPKPTESAQRTLVEIIATESA